MRTALKEWAVVCEALARGEQSLLLRKGGIRERRAGFALEHRTFWLYPTSFHQDPEKLAPSVRRQRPPQPTPGTVALALYAEVADHWKVVDLEALRSLEGLHVLGWSTIAERFYYRKKPGLEVVLVRVYRPEHPQVLREQPQYAGCHSWMTLDASIAPAASVPVVGDSEFAALHRRLCTLLGPPGDGSI
ncbi:DUF1802 family protein [Gloeobacter morelensis]|uniref:DUF1802 family protein n=1 Tax=Gloeobacter morelensis MG652769 TaxID=2781736 RepID=A0ABY3PSA8_9CYAN|nr:DUF1802 family protein [Gloeobacter morelensis]UFP96363.1 DUF1802 family protein [Gloeobacter morelensis MG652769]